MNNNRPAKRVQLALIITLLGALGLGSFWILEVLRRNIGEEPHELPQGTPDYTVDKFRFTRMSETGQVRYIISGAKLTHYPDNDSFEIERPTLHNLNSHQTPISLHAERAVVEHENDKIHLYRNVQMNRPASKVNTGARPHFRLKSEYLLILPDADTVQTDRPVDIVYGQTHLTGIGMIANNATREFSLLRHVRGTYRAPLH